MRTGLPRWSPGIPLAFPIIYPLAQLPSRVLSRLSTHHPFHPPSSSSLSALFTFVSCSSCTSWISHVVRLYQLQDFPTSRGKTGNSSSLFFLSLGRLPSRFAKLSSVSFAFVAFGFETHRCIWLDKFVYLFVSFSFFFFNLFIRSPIHTIEGYSTTTVVGRRILLHSTSKLVIILLL